MNRYILFGVPTVASILLLGATTALVKAHDDARNESSDSSLQEAHAPPCQLEMTRALYGFQCLGSAFNGSTLEPVSFAGTVKGDGRGFFEGFGTFNSSNGSASLHLAGHGTLLPR